MAFDWGQLLQGIGQAGQSFMQDVDEQNRAKQGRASHMQEQLAIMKGDFSNEVKEDAARNIMQRMNPSLVKKMDTATQSYYKDQRDPLSRINEIGTARQKFEDPYTGELDASVKPFFDNLLKQELSRNTSKPATEPELKSGMTDRIAVDKVVGGNGKSKSRIKAKKQSGNAGASGVKDAVTGSFNAFKDMFDKSKSAPSPIGVDDPSRGARAIKNRDVKASLSKEVHGPDDSKNNIPDFFFQSPTAIAPSDTVPKSYTDIGITEKADIQTIDELQKAVPDIDLKQAYATEPKAFAAIFRWLRAGKDDEGNPFTIKDAVKAIKGTP